jgi:AAA domain
MAAMLRERCGMTGHTYSPGPDGFCGVCQEPDGYCQGTRAASSPRRARPANAALALAVVPNGSKAPPVGRQVVVTLASQIKPQPVRWLWPDRIPAGALTLLAGREGIGKSLVGVYLAAQLTRGTLPGGRHGRPSRVMFATSEDAWEFTMVPRLLAAGADLSRVGRVQVEDDGIITGLTTPVDVPALKGYIATHDVAMLVLDPLTSVMDGRIDAHRDREVRKALEPLGQSAEDTGAAVLGLVHLGKGMGNDPVNLILGSRAFSAVARVALVAARDPEDETSNVLSVEKSNLGRIDVPGLTYRVDGVEIATDEGLASAGLLVWTGETDRRVRDIMADHGGESSDRAGADGWLRELLADGPIKATEVYSAADAAGLSKDKAKRAKKRIRAVAGKVGMDGPWYWALPEHEGDLDDLPEESTNSPKSAGHESLHPSLPLADYEREEPGDRRTAERRTHT